MGGFKVLFLSPSQLKPSNHLCFWISRIPPLPNPSLSEGVSRHSFLIKFPAFLLIFREKSMASMPFKIML